MQENRFPLKNENCYFEGKMINAKGFILIAATFLASTAFIFSRSSIHFERVEYDFGRVAENTVQRCEFVFHNRGSGTLVIEHVSAG